MKIWHSAKLTSQPIAQIKAPKGNTTSAGATPVPTPDTSRPSTPFANQLLTAKGGPKGSSRRARKAAGNTLGASSGEEDLKRRRPKTSTKAQSKTMRVWDGALPTENTGETLDYSSDIRSEDDAEGRATPSGLEDVDSEAFGTRKGGHFILKDLDDEVHSILADANAKMAQSSAPAGGVVGAGLGALSGLFRNIVGGKVLTKEDLEKPMKGMEEHLLNKNVAQEAARRLCEGVQKELIGVKTGSFESESQ